MVERGVMGLGEVGGSEIGVIKIREVSRQEEFRIEELCNRFTRDSRR